MITRFIPLLLVLIPFCFNAQTMFILDSTILESRVISQDLVNPWDLVWGPDDEIWFTTKHGYIMKVDPVSLNQDTIHFISETFVSALENSGLHALGLHPHFPDTPYVYTHYTYDTLAARLTRWTYDQGSQTFTDSLRIITTMPGARSHNGSRLQWDTDSTFLLTTGDAYLFSIAQDFNSYSGKILRFKYDGSIPDDNPWTGSANYALGFRNPQGLVILPNGTIFASEHGTSKDDEINHIMPGRNYGWPNVLGACDSTFEMTFCADSNVVEPIYSWTPTRAVCGLEWYDHPQIPELRGSLLVATLKVKRILYLPIDTLTNTADTFKIMLADSFLRIRDVLVAPNGNVYLATSNHENSGPPILPNDDKIIEIFNPNYVSGIKEQTAHNQILVYPNPTHNQLNIRGELIRKGCNVKVVDISGKIVLSEQVQTPSFKLDVSTITSGLYFIKVQNGIEWASVKFVKE